MRRTAAGLLLLATVTLTTACSGENRPPTQKIENGIVEQDGAGITFSDKQASCLADLYRNSDLSAQYLDSLAAGEQPKPNDDDLEELAELGLKSASDCPP